jgi:gamma-glutamyltranspeptidase/glutathione hydrolase
MIPKQPLMIGRRYMVSAGQYLATEAAHAMLAAGGNAIDAGVAAGIALGVVHSEQVQFSGVAPMVIYLARERKAISITGVGPWPRSVRIEDFITDGKGAIPEDITRCVVPAAPAAWILALEKFGTRSFAEVAAPAIRYARDGFAVHRVMATFLADRASSYQRWPQNAAIYCKDGKPLQEGDLLVQTDLAASIQYMVDQETSAAGKGRTAALQAARDAFYKGDIAQKIVAFHRENGGYLQAEDLSDFECEIEVPLRLRYEGVDVFSCGAWCQGPTLLQMLSFLKGTDLKAMGHNSVAYIHHLTQVMDLCFADREKYIGDPKFIDVPLDVLLSEAYASVRRTLIDHKKSFGAMPPAGNIAGRGGVLPVPQAAVVEPGLPGDTSYVGVVDAEGNAFSCSPSDVSWESPIIPGLGFCPSTRGSQSWAVPGHASALRAGKRPRLTPNPSLAIKEGAFIMPFGAPGGDMQPQGMLQVLLNFAVFGMDIQSAIEAPRFVSRNFPDSFEPHPYYPGRIDLEVPIGSEIGDALAAKGHTVHWLPEFSLKTAGVHAVVADATSGRLYGGADPRRTGRAMGW